MAVADEKKVKNEGDEGAKDQADASRNTIPSTEGPTSAKDPLERLIDIFKDPGLTDEEKRYLAKMSTTRFTNRRIMAYIALGGIVATLLFIGGAAIYDGPSATCTTTAGSTVCKGILAQLSQVTTLLGVVNTVLTGIIAAYYGSSTFRPSS